MPDNPNGRKLGFITHAVAFLAVVGLLAVINTLTRNELRWWAIVGLAWGIGVTAHFAVTFLPLTLKKQPLGPVDIIGISAGSIALLVAIFSIGIVGRMPAADASRRAESEARGERFSWGSELREENDQTVPGAFREIEIRTIAGSIDVSGGAAGGVEVHSVKTARSASDMDAIHVDIQTLGDRLVIQEKRDRIAARSGSIAYTVRIPAGLTSIVADSISGSIEVSDAGPGIDQNLHTVSGRIRSGLARDLRAETISGRIEFASEGKRVEAKTVSGSIEADIRAVAEGGSISMGTISGSVRLAAFAELDAELSLHSLSGSISCDFPVTASVQKNNTLEGRIGSGRIPVTVGTTSGSIAISRR